MMQKTHHLYAFLAGLIHALNCYDDVIEYYLIGLAEPVVSTHESRHDNAQARPP